jgi:hypothetical protein
VTRRRFSGVSPQSALQKSSEKHLIWEFELRYLCDEARPSSHVSAYPVDKYSNARESDDERDLTLCSRLRRGGWYD